MLLFTSLCCNFPFFGGYMKTVCKYLLDKRYLILILAAAIIGQCYLQLMLPEYMGKIQNIVN